MLLAIMKEWAEEALQLLTTVLPVQHTEDALLQRNLKKWATETLQVFGQSYAVLNTFMYF